LDATPLRREPSIDDDAGAHQFEPCLVSACVLLIKERRCNGWEPMALLVDLSSRR
jgi:hypothetical protein